ncbi:hypothetical protein Ami103574_06460 [Aminipila butyrica]|uniref:Uncharacterized protein n=1 Tax=Aminipila butyrica TaxID=433296 RepID=A0A858BY38_9FIRM|nr:hypothetical protein [Aminipila butyrica]QIB68986.1 hypothetical protein Ami103574_06460 [Aminipila butyrica]
MSWGNGRVLPGLLAVCLMLCQPISAFGDSSEEPVALASDRSDVLDVDVSESSIELELELEQKNPIGPKPEPENSAKPEVPVEPEAEPEETGAFLQPQSDEAPDSSDALEQTEFVSNEQELKEWIAQHKETGGTVYLSDRVIITQAMGIYGIRGKITVNTGIYGLVFNGGTLPSSDILITGEGVEMPVVKVPRTDSGMPNESNWNETLLQLNVTATGRDGEGGTALRISDVNTRNFDMTLLSWQGVLRSYGKEAVGLWLDAPMEAWCYRVEVSGENSTAVYAPKGAALFYCKLTAEGDGAAAAAGSDISLESCAASPAPAEVRSINRLVMKESFSRLYLPLRQNQYHLSAIDMLSTPNIFLIEEAGGVTSQVFAIDWDLDVYDGIDTSILGTTIVQGTANSALYGLGLFDDVPITLTVEVRDPELPCISQIAVRELEGSRYAVLNFWQDYDPMDERIILWRSDDQGETWMDATHSPDILWDGSSVNFSYETLEHPVWFQLEVTGVGESNIAILDEKDGVFIGGNGGDRTGTDRGGVKPPDGGSKGGNKGSGTRPDRSNGSIAENNEGLKDNESSTAKVDSVAGGESDERFVTAIPADALPLDMETEDIHGGTLTEVVPAQRIPDEAQRETAERVLTPANTEEVLLIEEAATLVDPEQSAPELNVSVKIWTVLFLSVAGLCAGMLLFLRFGRHGRWRREKP